ncbi:MAG: hypothetical protein LBE85_11715 [Candidatus Accumulibacter sp.]|jgi:hypothetical protein|nr:hypothetical protein [Accumulibacter sp.]
MEAALVLLDRVAEAHHRMDAMAEALDWDGIIGEWQEVYPRIVELRQLPLDRLGEVPRARAARRIAELIELQERISARITPWMEQAQPLLEVFRKYPVSASGDRGPSV